MMRELEEGANGATVDPRMGASNPFWNNALNVAEIPAEAASLISAALATGAGSRPRRGRK